MTNEQIVSCISQALDYIRVNLDRPLTTEEIADHCRFSRFHFSRMFRGVVGESLYACTRRLRLERAAYRLRTNPRLTVTEAALDAGYSPSNFATAFREQFGMSASAFRSSGAIAPMLERDRLLAYLERMRADPDALGRIRETVQIRTMQPMRLHYRRHIGPYVRLHQFWKRFSAECATAGLVEPDSRWVGISYDDPLVTEANRCMYDMCLEMRTPPPPPCHAIEGGLYACLPFEGTGEYIAEAYNDLMALWMPDSPYMPDNRPVLEMYEACSVPGGPMRLQLCLPLVEA